MFANIAWNWGTDCEICLPLGFLMLNKYNMASPDAVAMTANMNVGIILLIQNCAQ
jgi:hypothetical protein